jgi:hypothetical protein
MRPQRHATRTGRRWLLATLIALTICCGCTMNGNGRQWRPVLVVGESRAVVLTDPNEPFVSSRPGVWMERGRYLELCDIEADVQSGRLVRRHP